METLLASKRKDVPKKKKSSACGTEDSRNNTQR
jgi:hypothetical protein